jgi:hypothetical protein
VSTFLHFSINSSCLEPSPIPRLKGETVIAPEADPLTFVRTALAPMPDPEDASADQLAQLTAIGTGLRTHLDAIASDTNALAHRVVDGADKAEAGAEIRWLIALRERCEQAEAQLKTYTFAACRARGINPDRLAGR